MAQRYIVIFQYGSNMSPDRLNATDRLAGAAQVVGVAQLKGWGIRFDLYSKRNGCGVTDMIPNAREYVEGVLYRVPYRMVIAPRGQRSRMDEIEGAGLGVKSNYKRRKISINRHGEMIEARTYVGTVLGRKRFLCRPDHEKCVSQEYFNHLLTGARQFHFSECYIAYLRKQAGM